MKTAGSVRTFRLRGSASSRRRRPPPRRLRVDCLTTTIAGAHRGARDSSPRFGQDCPRVTADTVRAKTAASCPFLRRGPMPGCGRDSTFPPEMPTGAGGTMRGRRAARSERAGSRTAQGGGRFRSGTFRRFLSAADRRMFSTDETGTCTPSFKPLPLPGTSRHASFSARFRPRGDTHRLRAGPQTPRGTIRVFVPAVGQSAGSWRPMTNRRARRTVAAATETRHAKWGPHRRAPPTSTLEGQGGR